MKDSLIIEKAIEELKSKTFGATEQFLKVHDVVHVNHKPQALRVDKENSDSTAIVYFPVKGEQFFFAVWLDTIPEIKVTGVGTENYNSVYLKVVSDELSFHELSLLTELTPTGGWSKGEMRKSGRAEYKFSALHFEPNPEPDSFEDKLNKLIDILERHKPGLARLQQHADVLIQVVTVFHNGNTMLGGHHLDKGTLRRIADLNLEINFDLYAEGNLFKD